METEVEPPFRTFTPDGRIMVEVRQENDIFYCRTVLDGHETDSMATLEHGRVLTWVKTQMVEAMRRTPKDVRIS